MAIVDGRMREEGGNKFNYILLRFVVAVFSFFPSSFSGSVGDGYDDPDVVFERGAYGKALHGGSMDLVSLSG